jgi:hypothetical protein
MGVNQSKSISNYTYTEANKIIQQAQKYKEYHWHSTTTKDGTLYWLGNNKKMTILILPDEWPVVHQIDDDQLIEGHHYFIVQTADQAYYYDVDNESWLETIPESMNIFVGYWQELITDAEDKANIEEAEKKSTAETQQSGGNRNHSYELTLNEQTVYPISSLIKNVVNATDNTMLISDCVYTAKVEDDVNASIIMTDNVDYVKSIISDHWAHAKQTIVNGQKPKFYPKITVRNDNSQIFLACKGKDAGMYLIIDHISNKNIKSLSDYMDQKNIPYEIKD